MYVACLWILELCCVCSIILRMKWVGTAAVFTYTPLCMPTLKDEEVIKWLHSLAHPAECYQEKTWGCPSRGLSGKGSICSLANTFSLAHEYEGTLHGNRAVSNMQSFMIALLHLPTWLSIELINQIIQANNPIFHTLFWQFLRRRCSIVVGKDYLVMMWRKYTMFGTNLINTHYKQSNVNTA